MDKQEQNEKVEKIEINDDQEVSKNIKKNEELMKEKVNEILNDFKENDELYKRKNRRKTFIYIIGIIIEIIIIFFIVKTRYLNKEENNLSLKCSSTIEDNVNNASITINNIYYFDKKKNVNKTENNLVYIFNSIDDYTKFKENYIYDEIKDFSGIDQQSIFDDTKYIYKKRTIYDYSKLIKNNKVTNNKDELILSIPNIDEPIIIKKDNYDMVLRTNENMNYICE